MNSKLYLQAVKVVVFGGYLHAVCCASAEDADAAGAYKLMQNTGGVGGGGAYSLPAADTHAAWCPRGVTAGLA